MSRRDRAFLRQELGARSTYHGDVTGWSGSDAVSSAGLSRYGTAGGRVCGAPRDRVQSCAVALGAGAAGRRPRCRAGRRPAAGGALVRLERQALRTRRSRGAAAAWRQHHLRHDRSVRGGIPVVLRQFRQWRAVATAALPPRPGRVPARGLRGLSRGQPPLRRGTGQAAARRRPDLGARLPPVPAGRGTAPARRAQPHRLLPAHAVRAAGAAARLAARRGIAARHVRLRCRGLPHTHLSARLPGMRAARSSRHRVSDGALQL